MRCPALPYPPPLPPPALRSRSSSSAAAAAAEPQSAAAVAADVAAGLPANLAGLPRPELLDAVRQMVAVHEGEVATLRKEKAVLVQAVKAARAREAAAAAAAGSAAGAGREKPA